jgi:hypothetical protein
MAYLKKNQLNNIILPMVDKTDFATIESGLDAADINIKLYGVAQGASTLASTITVSKAARLIRSGIFQITLEATETDAHDEYMLRLSSTSTVSCAIQLFRFQMVDNDDSDMYLAISDLRSTVDSQFAVVSNYLSNLSALVSDVDSQLLLNASMISDVQSAVDSQFLIYQSDYSDLISNLSNVHSDLGSKISAGGGGATPSAIASKVWSDYGSKVGVSICQ